MITREFKHYDLNEVFFPVEEQPIGTVSRNGTVKHIPGYKAIVERNTGRTFSVVSNKYRLIHNREAFAMADYVVREVFEDKTLNDFICYNVLMPYTKGSCRIDMIIPNNFNRLFGNETESYTPFVRISNSYNRTTTLRFEIGFCRWICKNGVIFGEMGFNFSVSHTDNFNFRDFEQLASKARKQIGSVGSIWAAFEQKMSVLKDISVPASLVLPLYCKAFDILVDTRKVTSSQMFSHARRAKQVVAASKDYFHDLGPNAYALMNVMTDTASFPEWTTNPSNHVDGYQRRVGKWVDNLIDESHRINFTLTDYIDPEYQASADYLESLITEKTDGVLL